MSRDVLRALVLRARDALVGRPIALSSETLRRHPELGEVRWRAGGVPLRVGGWCLGRRTVAGITLGRTVLLADPGRATPALLLHELAHARQFARTRGFAVRYCWESLRHGYTGNRYEAEADSFAAERLAEVRGPGDRAGAAASCPPDLHPEEPPRG